MTSKIRIRLVIKRGIGLFLIMWFALSMIQGQTEPINGYKLKTVVIDAGHGGKDPGSVGKSGTEKEVVLAIALKLGQYIEEKLPEVKVVYTRKTDEFVPLHKRADIANSHKADLYISIHANGNHNPQVMGTETLVLGLHRAEENFEVAKKENAVILLEDDYSTHYEGFDPNSPESYMIFSLMQNLFFEQSINFAAYVQDQLRERVSRIDRGVKQQGLLVLARTSMPGVLIETGFMTHPDEEKFLLSVSGQDYIASAIFRAFRDFKSRMENKNTYIALASGNSDSGKTSVTSDTLVRTGAIQVEPTGKTTKAVIQHAADTIQHVVFGVQILASSKKISTKDPQFKGYEDIMEYQTGNIFKYVVKGSSSYDETFVLGKKVKSRFPDAFVIAVKDGKIIPLDQALKEYEYSIKTNNP